MVLFALFLFFRGIYVLIIEVTELLEKEVGLLSKAPEYGGNKLHMGHEVGIMVVFSNHFQHRS